MRNRGERVVRGLGLGCVLAVLAGLGAAAPASAASSRVDSLVARMTLDEELSLVGSGIDGVPRLGIPPLKFIDGPNGVGEGTKGVTAFPNAVSIGASWDPGLARRYGAALGDEAANTGHSLIGAPTINIVRTPLWGRAAETLGEDPFLTGRLDAPEIQGIQSRRIIAQVKHYAANNQELLRFGPALGTPGVDVRVSDRALHEIYFPGFRSAVGPGGAASVMCSYNRINGLQSCQDPATLALLRGFGLRGFVGPDATLAVRDVVTAARAGVENFQLGSLVSASAGAAGGQGRAETQILRTAVTGGQLPKGLIDADARDILTAMERVGLLDHPHLVHRADVSTAAHRALATSISTEGTVLLKDARGVLPLTRRTRSLAVIGHDAGPGTYTEENGSPAVRPGRRVITPLAGIRARAPRGTRVRYAAGTRGVVSLPIVPASALTPSAGSGHGLSGAYFASSDGTGAPLLEKRVPTVDFAGRAKAPLQPIPGTKANSARWIGTLTPPRTGRYVFSLGLSGRGRLTIGNRVVVAADTEWRTAAPLDPGAPPVAFQGTVALRAHHPVKVSLDYSTGVSIAGAELHLGWSPPSPATVARAVAAARRSRVAVVFANDSTSEGMDRTSLDLPGDQNRLIEAVARANPRTVVVLHTSGPVLMPWRRRVAAIVEAWYPGQMSGRAIARTLFGDADPSGRLPVTWPAANGQGPASTAASYPGTNDIVHYSEGLRVGYRWYDSHGRRPLFPFGYGLSYTRFHLGRLTVRARGGDRFALRVPVRNTGRRRGAEVVQAYVGDPAAAGEPPRQLKGFARVVVRPGRTAVARMTLGPDAFATWSTAARRWVVPKGRYRILVGTSSRALPRRATVTVAGR